MGDWIGLAVIGFIVLCAVFAVWQLSKPYDVTVEEFEKRAHEAPSLMSAGLVGLQKILDPATAKAVEAQEEEEEERSAAEPDEPTVSWDVDPISLAREFAGLIPDAEKEK